MANTPACVRACAGKDRPRPGRRYISLAHGADNQIDPVDTNAGDVQWVCVDGIDECDLGQIPALLMNGEQPESRLSDQCDVMAGCAGGSDDPDENRSCAGDGQRCSAGQCAVWQQFRQRRGRRDGAQTPCPQRGCQRFVGGSARCRCLDRRYRAGRNRLGQVRRRMITTSRYGRHLPAQRCELVRLA